MPPQGGGRPQTKPIGLLDLVCYLMAHLGGGTPTVGVDLRHFLGVILRGKKAQKHVLQAKYASEVDFHWMFHSKHMFFLVGGHF